PMRPCIHAWYADALLTTKSQDDAKKALEEAEVALAIPKPTGEDVDPLDVLSPEDAALAHVAASEAALALGDKTKAKDHAQQALPQDASNARAKAVLAKLK